MTPLYKKISILRKLDKKDAEWSWCPEHERAFAEINNIITEDSGRLLQYYDPAKPVKVRASRCVTNRSRSGDNARWETDRIRLENLNSDSTSVRPDRKEEFGCRIPM